MSEKEQISDSSKLEKFDNNSSSDDNENILVPPSVPELPDELLEQIDKTQEIIGVQAEEAELPDFKSEIGRRIFGQQTVVRPAPPIPPVPKELRKLFLNVELKDDLLDGVALISELDARKITDLNSGILILEDSNNNNSIAVKFQVKLELEEGMIQINRNIISSYNIKEKVSIRLYQEEPIKVDNVTLAVSPIAGNDIFHVVGSLRKSIAKLKKILENYVVKEGLVIKWKERNASIKITNISPQIAPKEMATFDFTKPRVLSIKPDGALEFNTILIMDISKSMNGRDLEVKNVIPSVESIQKAFTYEGLDDFLKEFKDGNNVKRKSGAIFAGLLYLSEKARIGIGETVSLIVFADSAEILKVDNKPYVIADQRSKTAFNLLVEQMFEDLEEKMGAGTNMASALELCDEIIKNLPRSKRKKPLMIILLTDGFDTSQRVKEVVISNYANKENIVLHAVGLGPYVNKKELVEISDLCGGELFLPEDLGELLHWYSRRAKELSIKLNDVDS